MDWHWGGGFNRFDPETEQFISYRRIKGNPNSTSGQYVQEISGFRYGAKYFLWIGTNYGLDKFDYVEQKFTRYPPTDKEWPNNYIVPISVNRSGNVWIGCLGGGLHYFNAETEQYLHYLYNSANPKSLSNNFIYSLYEDHFGLLWIGTMDGLNQLDPETGQFTRYYHDPANPKSLRNNDILSLYEDHSGLLWIGTSDGLHQFDREREQFICYYHDPKNPKSLSDNSITAIYEANSGVLWIGSEVGLNRFVQQKKQFKHYWQDPTNSNSLYNKSVMSVYETSDGGRDFLWVGTRNDGIYKINRKTGSIINYRHDANNPNSLSNNWARIRLQSRFNGKDELWISSDHGLNKLDPITGQFTRYLHDPEDPKSIGSNIIWDVFEDRAGVLWIGMFRSGLQTLNRTTGQFTQIGPKMDVHHIFEDNSGNFWIAVFGGGIYCSDSEVILTNVVIAKNNAESGGGICCNSSTAILTNVSIAENSSLINGGGILCGSGGYASLMNTILWNNSPESVHLDRGSINALYSDIQDVLVGDSNIDADPLFVDTIHYYLSENSPCVDSGHLDTLFNDRENPENPGSALWPALGTLQNDIGAYGGHGRFKKIPPERLPDVSIGYTDFINGQVAWLRAGLYGDEKLMKTGNGGQTWDTITVPVNVIGFDFVNESVGWVLGRYDDQWDELIKTVDGGQNWVRQRIFPNNIEVTAGQAVNDWVVYLVTSINDEEYPSGRIIKTMDGGSTWIDVSPHNDRWEFGSLSFIDGAIGVVSGQNGNRSCFFNTFTGGASWVKKSCLDSSHINNLQFINSSSNYFLSDNRILYKTSDLYLSWNKILDGVTSYSAVGKDTIFAIIEDQKFMKSFDRGNTWDGIHLGKDVFETIKFVDNSTGWIVGDNGTILKTTDGGKSWGDRTPDIFMDITDIIEDEHSSRRQPVQFKLFQNYPNPFNPSTKIKFALPKPIEVKIAVYNTLGQKVKILLNKAMNAGHHEVEFNAKNLSSGVYYYRIEAGKFHKVKKMILIR